MSVSGDNPANPEAPAGRLAGPPSALRPGVAQMDPPSAAAPNDEHQGHGAPPVPPAAAGEHQGHGAPASASEPAKPATTNDKSPTPPDPKATEPKKTTAPKKTAAPPKTPEPKKTAEPKKTEPKKPTEPQKPEPDPHEGHDMHKGHAH